MFNSQREDSMTDKRCKESDVVIILYFTAGIISLNADNHPT